MVVTVLRSIRFAAVLLVMGAVMGLSMLAAGPASATTTHGVMISNFAFGPASLTIESGDTVTWTNHDQAPHNIVTTSAPASISSPLINKGGSWSYTFSTAGTYHYICGVHPDMKATITVVAKPTPVHTSTAPSTTATHPHSSSPAMVMTTPARTGAPAHKPTASTSAAAPRASVVAAAPSTTPDPPTPAAQAGGVRSARLKPLLLVAGLIAAVTVFCLLALAARPSE